MNGTYLQYELTAIQSRTRKFMWTSSAAHVIFFIMLSLLKTIAPESEGLVVISWLEPVVTPVSTAKTTSPLPEETVTRASSQHRTKEHFVRDEEEADVAPKPQMVDAMEDRLSEKLLSLQRAAVDRNVQIASVSAPNIVTKPTLAGVTAEENSPGTPDELTREPVGSPRPAELRRLPVNTTRPAIAKVQTREIETTPSPAKATDSTARRTLAGASLTGPVADRPLLSYRKPLYPEWAKREGVEGSATIYFVVLPDGRVKQNVVVQKTSGFEDFDRNAIEALLAWRFEELRGSGAGEQWGTITFHYRLNDMISSEPRNQGVGS